MSEPKRPESLIEQMKRHRRIYSALEREGQARHAAAMTHRMATVCPHCGARHDRAGDPLDPSAKPKAGSVSICIVCAGLMVFTTDEGDARAASIEEFSGEARQQIVNLIRITKELGARPR